jgi:imidazolonepropionase-like amidohydrolase
LRKAVDQELPVAFGTDVGVIPHGRNAGEFELLRDVGLQSIEVARTATLHAAAAAGMSGEIGVLDSGASADVPSKGIPSTMLRRSRGSRS